jgi:periplasmic glucans biosynthesis protein
LDAAGAIAAELPAARGNDDMTSSVDRRQFAAGVAASGLLGAVVPATPAHAAASLTFGPTEPFQFDTLKARAREMAAKPYISPPRPAPEIVSKIDYGIHGTLRYKTSQALNADGPGNFPVTFFHLGQYFQKSVRMFQVAGGQAREVIYKPDLFDMPADSVARGLPDNAGFAGFRFQESRQGQPDRSGKGKLDWKTNDWAAFLGASYVRAIGADYQYGMSARGLALDTAVSGVTEEFPDFTDFYIEADPGQSNTATVYALLSGPSIAGAYKFRLERGVGVIMDVEASLHVRQPVQRFCLAPLTSMYWYSETNRTTSPDWRPEVHDSDGLALWTGAGERIWRPLNNPARTTVSAFADDNPKGFGLSQRDRSYGNYLDGVHYERRPSVWVEPKGAWGRGSVQLIEIPTEDEVNDNIVAAWVPAEAVKAGQVIDIAYRMHWQNDAPHDAPGAAPLARTVATRTGLGGEPGTTIRPKTNRKFIVEFLGGPLTTLSAGVTPEAVITTSRGKLGPKIFTEALANDVPGHWRTIFDIEVGDTSPVELRLFLRNGSTVLSETWAYQYHPSAM